MFEFEFTYKDGDVFYITHTKNAIDNELFQDLKLIDFSFDKIESFKVYKLNTNKVG